MLDCALGHARVCRVRTNKPGRALGRARVRIERLTRAPRAQPTNPRALRATNQPKTTCSKPTTQLKPQTQPVRVRSLSRPRMRSALLLRISPYQKMSWGGVSLCNVGSTAHSKTGLSIALSITQMQQNCVPKNASVNSMAFNPKHSVDFLMRASRSSMHAFCVGVPALKFACCEMSVSRVLGHVHMNLLANQLVVEYK